MDVASFLVLVKGLGVPPSARAGGWRMTGSAKTLRVCGGRCIVHCLLERNAKRVRAAGAGQHKLHLSLFLGEKNWIRGLGRGAKKHPEGWRMTGSAASFSKCELDVASFLVSWREKLRVRGLGEAGLRHRPRGKASG